MQKWEYCMLTGVIAVGENHALTSHNPRLFRFTSKGQELVTDFKNRPRGVDEIELVTQLIAQLGDEGWELVTGDLSYASGKCSYLLFKRPKS